ncbi:interferon-induced protein 44-like isoform X1 [Haliotis rufescens]|uniref:interferon-induced protein 44-like isoform X1 n=1 Tax=Haliotis rufescens TaxID=6454 RepID=UPI00201F1B6B|nr:interferon-induced protein 44-like isoform X1 [Haliotis rufescens]XP_048238761.1 interferon-induced protein 44-like isoform X1 [Haliotis rufescens]
MSWLGYVPKGKLEEVEELARKESRRTNEALKLVKEQGERAKTLEAEMQHLQFEKEEKEKRDKKLMQFSWGPKNKAAGQWTTQEFEQLQTKFFKHLKDPEGNLIRAKILIFGPTGAGKSSFCNGLRSALKDSDTPSNYYAVGNIGTTLTSRFQASRYGDHWIIDMPGIFESGDFKTENIEAIASGKVRFDAQITKTLEVEDGQSQQEARRDVSCVVLVLHHNIDLGEELKRQLNVIMQLGGKGVLSYHLVLTHLDECDPQFKDPDNLPNLYNSPLVQEAVKNMSEQTGIQPCSISYVKNYVTETETDTKTKLLHLKALDRILNSAADQVEKIIDSKLQSSMYDDAPDA